MSNYTPYPVYKISEVDWIDEVPKHWSRAAIKYLLSTPITDGPHETPDFISDGIEFLSVDGIQDGELVFDGKRFISQEDHTRFSKKAKPQFNDVLVGKSASVGKVARVKTFKEFNVWSPLAILRASDSKCLPAYLEYALKSNVAQQQMILAGNVSTQANLGMDRLTAIGVPLPPIEEQGCIVQVIDREAARIDALIAKKTRFIELLKEKRQALITHAVTKGVNPNVELKDSGSEWIGSVPKHWTLSKLGYITAEQGGNTPNTGNDNYWNGEIPWVSPKDMKTTVITDSIDHITQLAVDECGMALIPEKAVLVVVRGMILAHSFPVAEAAKPVTINQDMKALVATGEIISSYLRLVLESAKSYVVRVLVAEAAHGTRVLRTDIWKQLPVPLPTLVEQKQIIKHVTATSDKYDRLSSLTQRSINLLKEHRAALITAAVTGKIDLRESV